MQKITPCLWFDDKGKKRPSFMCRFSRIPRLERSPVMEKRAQRSPEDRRVRS